ncbi:hypothetical protein Pmani_023842 [Petrolisthes manimaculis]|uniref:Uncharacterized protein n=1 Tax=Petrolisthes manimaculis TaxID=1843537 RepID=A0AAE1P9X3_9EUCA|nr:hypothetical protein Pmani_023842 [Petrolisthes manimaculis]
MHLSFLPPPPATMNTVLLVLASVLTLSLAAPQLFGRGRVGGEESTAAILLDDRSNDHDGNFSYEYVTENGIVVTVAGRRGSRGQSNMLGSYSTVSTCILMGFTKFPSPSLSLVCLYTRPALTFLLPLPFQEPVTRAGVGLLACPPACKASRVHTYIKCIPATPPYHTTRRHEAGSSRLRVLTFHSQVNSSSFVPQLLFSCLIAAAAAAPQFGSEFTQPQDRPLAIVKDERQNTGDGNFNYDFETENGIVVNVVGNLGPQGQNMQGGFR